MASEEITNETAEQPVEAATPAPVAETPAAAVSAPEEIKKPEPRKDIFAELGLGGDDDKPKILKAKGSKNVSTGVVHVSSTFNNTVVTVTDQRGNVIGWSSAGKMGFGRVPARARLMPGRWCARTPAARPWATACVKWKYV